MQRRSRIARIVTGPLAAALVAVFASAICVSACSNQGEGERCDNRGDNAGNDECQDGLTCTPVTGSYRCCPTDRTAATVAECRQSQSTGATPDASIPNIEAGPGTDANADAAGDASGDASRDTGADASGDASNPDTGTTDASDGSTALDAGDAGG